MPAVLPVPPVMLVKSSKALLFWPPLTLVKNKAAMLKRPPLTLEKKLPAVFEQDQIGANDLKKSNQRVPGNDPQPV